jgi:beta-1,4-mannosyl-glycoprotein beta-1,4-N-acetylglucosaminyltransferase
MVFMKKYLVIFFCFINLFLYSNQTNIKVYDCFTFFNELDILEIRLNELYDVVDYFVIVENSLTFSGNPKPLYFEENKQRFSKFSNKIIHIVGQKVEIAKDAWVREIAQRNDIMLGLKNAKDDDIVIISDVDEIVKKEKIREIRDFFINNENSLRLAMKMYRYFLNRRDMEVNIWPLAYAITYKTLKTFSPQYFRTQYQHINTLSDAGWHFTSLGWTKENTYKLNSWSHQERNLPKNKDPYKLLKKARKGKLVKINDSYPRYVVENIDYFKKINFIDDNYPLIFNIWIFNKRQNAIEKKL